MRSLFVALCCLVLFEGVAWPHPLEKKIGVIIPLTGDFARYGQKVRIGIDQVPGPGVHYIYEDEGCEPAKAISSYRKLTSVDGVKFFLGPWCGSPQTAIAPLLQAGKQVAILGSSAPRRVFKVAGGRMFSAQHSIEEESIFNANQAYRLGARRVVIVFFENEFSRAHERAFRDTFKGEVLETITYASVDAAALKPVALRIKRLNPDALYIPDAFPLMQGLLREVYNLGLGDKKFFSVYSAQSNDVLQAAGKYGEGLVFSYPAIRDEEALVYFPKLAAKLLIDAMEKCAANDDTCVIRALKRDNNFDEFGVLRGELMLKTIKNGRFVLYDRSISP